MFTAVLITNDETVSVEMIIQHSWDKFLEKLNQDVLIQLLQEGGVTEELLVLPKPLHGNLLQLIAVV